MKDKALKLAGITFAVIFLMHITGLIFKEPLMKLGFSEPSWYGIIVLIFAFFMSVFMFRSLR